jgi:recombinational DNA repair ATPase RecF
LPPPPLTVEDANGRPTVVLAEETKRVIRAMRAAGLLPHYYLIVLGSADDRREWYDNDDMELFSEVPAYVAHWAAYRAATEYRTRQTITTL